MMDNNETVMNVRGRRFLVRTEACGIFVNEPATGEVGYTNIHLINDPDIDELARRYERRYGHL